MASANTVQPSTSDSGLSYVDPETYSVSPFDQIKKTRDDGSEFWSARDLAPMMGYTEGSNKRSTWQNFKGNVIERAMKAAENQNVDLASHFEVCTRIGANGGRPSKDYDLTRFAAYLVAMNGDPNKAEVAAAQAYFAINTHENEVRKQQAPQFQLPSNFVEALEALVVAEKDKIVLTNENKQLALTNHTLDVENYELSAVNAEIKPLAEEYKALMDSRGTFSMMDAAKIVGIGRTMLFQFLRDEKILMSLGSNKNVAYQRYTNYFQTRAHRWEDRDGNSRVGKTTYVYPAGLDFIAKRLRKAGRI